MARQNLSKPREDFGGESRLCSRGALIGRGGFGHGAPLGRAQRPINTQRKALAVCLAAGGSGPSSGRKCTASEYPCGLLSIGASHRLYPWFSVGWGGCWEAGGQHGPEEEAGGVGGPCGGVSVLVHPMPRRFWSRGTGSLPVRTREGKEGALHDLCLLCLCGLCSR